MTDLSRTYQDLQSEGSAQCPSAETLAALTLGELPAAERERLADHAVGCRRCSRDAQILLRTHQEASHRLSSRFVRARWLGIAAAVTLIAAGGLLFRSAREGTSRSEGVSRGAGTGETRAGVVPRTGKRYPMPPIDSPGLLKRVPRDIESNFSTLRGKCSGRASASRSPRSAHRPSSARV